MKNINVMDIETYNDNGTVRPYCVSFFLNEKMYTVYEYENSFSTEKDVILRAIELILQKIVDKKIIFYVHNLNFDGFLILNTLTSYSIKFEWIIKELNLYLIKFEYLFCIFEFRCSYKLVPYALENFNKSTLKKEIFPHKFASKNNLFYKGTCPNESYFETYAAFEFFFKHHSFFDFQKVATAYCENDVKLTHFLLKNILNTMCIDLKKILTKSHSSPSLAFKFYFKKFNNCKIDKYLNANYIDYVRQAYFGGRCEVFGNPCENEIINYFDFSGMYGQCMLEEFHVGKPIFKNNNLNINECGFHTIMYESNLDLPILPYKDSKLIFPNGNLIGTFWWEEIKLFLKEGGKIKKHFSSLIFNETGFVFKEYVNHFTNIKNKGEFYRIFAKLMINSLYGSFALNEEDFFTIFTFNEQEFQILLETTNVIAWFKNNSCIVMKIKKDYKSINLYKKKNLAWENDFKNRNVSYAAAIASKARVKLYNAFKDVLHNKGRLLYCDTDSIFAAFKKDQLNNKHGEITWTETYEDAVFISSKFYGCKNKNKSFIKIKGLHKKDLNFDDIKEKFYKNDTNLFFKDELQFNKKEFYLKQKYIEKTIGLNMYNKRIFDNNKKNTSPLFLEKI